MGGSVKNITRIWGFELAEGLSIPEFTLERCTLLVNIYFICNKIMLKGFLESTECPFANY